MNVHVSNDIKKQFPGWEFRGKPYFDKNGKKWIKAKSNIFNKTWYYSFTENNIYDTMY